MDSSEFDVRNAIGLVRRQIWLILSTVLIIVGLAAVYVFLQTPTYTASTLILVDPRQKNALDPESQMSLLPTDNARVESEVEILKSPSTQIGAISRLELVKDPEFGVKLSTVDRLMVFFKVKSMENLLADTDAQLRAVLTRFSNNVTIARRGLTYVISVSATSADPAKAALIANTLSATYIDAQVDAKISNALSVRDALNRRLAQASTTINQNENRIDAFVNENIEKVSNESTRADISAMRASLENLKAESVSAQSLQTSVATLAANKDWDGIAAQLRSDTISQIKAERDKVLADIGNAAAGSARESNLRASLTELDKRLSDQVNVELGTLSERVKTAQQEQDRLRTSIRDTVLSSNLSNDVMVKIYELQQESSVAKTLYQDLLQRLRGVETQADLQLADSRIVSSALPPDAPSAPKTKLILTLALVAGLGLGLGLAFLNENFIGGFTSDQQFEAVLGVPVISSVPLLSRAGRSITERSQVASELLDHPLTAYSESIRRIRLGLENMLRRKLQDKSREGGLIVMVGSAIPGEGKTTTAIAIARAFAMSGKRVLLVDCDLRRPSIAPSLGLTPENGLADYLTLSLDSQSIRQFVTKDKVPGLDMIVGKNTHRTSTDSLIETAQFNLLMELAKERFEIIVLDTPPILPVVDAQYLATRADIVTLVVHWASTSQRDVRSAINDLRTTAGDELPIAAVLSKAELGVGSYRNKYNSYYYYAPES